MAGRPRAFKDVEELEDKIKDYFENITITYPIYDTIADGQDSEGNKIFKEVPRINNAGNQVYRTDYLEIPSIIGLCRYIGICKDTWNVYSNEPLYSDSIKIAKERIEQYLEEQLYRKEQVTGIIFNLKNNYGWKDKTEVETSGETTVNNKIDTSHLSTDEIRKILNESE